MEEFTDIPYSILKENKQAYEIMLLRDSYDNNYLDIAKKLEMSTDKIIQIYHRIKIKQLRLYSRHLAIVSGHKDVSEFKYMTLYYCYRDIKYVSAYWENKYTEILKEYRAGESGHSVEFLKALLPPIMDVTEDMVRQIVNMRENEKKTFIEIGRVMKMTKEKSRSTYEWFYYKKWLAAREKVQEIYNSDNCSNFYNEYGTAKKRFESIIKNYPEIFK